MYDFLNPQHSSLFTSALEKPGLISSLHKRHKLNLFSSCSQLLVIFCFNTFPLASVIAACNPELKMPFIGLFSLLCSLFVPLIVAQGQSTGDLPIVDLGYEVYQATVFNVSSLLFLHQTFPRQC